MAYRNKDNEVNFIASEIAHNIINSDFLDLKTIREIVKRVFDIFDFDKKRNPNLNKSLIKNIRLQEANQKSIAEIKFYKDKLKKYCTLDEKLYSELDQFIKDQGILVKNEKLMKTNLLDLKNKFNS